MPQLTSPNPLVEQLKQSKFRLTRARRALIEILSADRTPHSVAYLLQALLEQGIKVNKTTVYRELAFLQSEHLVRSLQLLDRGIRYELMDSPHHHHLVCVFCGEIDDVFFEQDIHEQEKRIETEKKFTIYNHSLEFYGCCAKCNQTNPPTLIPTPKNPSKSD